MSAWVFNASPLILLGKINQLALIEKLAPSVEIPGPVAAEISAGPNQDPAKLWLESSNVREKIVESTSHPLEILAWDLGTGETSVLSRVMQREGTVGVIDDQAARKCAEVFQLPVIGTVGILVKAKRAGLLTQLKPEIDRLVAAGSLLSADVIQKAVDLAGESS